MHRYEVRLHERWIRTFFIEADSPEEALALGKQQAEDGEYDSLGYVETMSVEVGE